MQILRTKTLSRLILWSVFLSVPAIAEVPEYDLIIRDHKFEPSVLEIPAGQKVKIIVQNLDATAEEFESYELRREKIIAGNSKAIIYVGPLKPGEYGFFGEFNPETAQGRLLVK